MIKYLFVIVFFFSFNLLLSQSVDVEKINGKIFYIHMVEKGNTLYQLKKIYSVSQKEILKANPNLNAGLIIGQRLLIPANPKTIHHKIKPKETLYSLAKKYKVSLKSIIKNNPGSKEGIKVGQIILIKNGVNPILERETIPSDTNGLVEGLISTLEFKNGNSIYLKADSIIEYIVQPGETIYSISKRYMCDINHIKKINNLQSSSIQNGQRILIPIHLKNGHDSPIRDITKNQNNNDSIADLQLIDSLLLFPNQKKIKIALFLPLYLDYNNRRSKAQVYSSIDFLMGISIALEKIKSDSLNLDLHVYDYMSDTTTIQEILKLPEFDSVDLIFSPYHPGEALIVSNWCVINNVPLITTVPMASKWITNNPMVYHGIIPKESIFQKMALDILEKHQSRQIVLINSAKASDEMLYESFRDIFYSDSNKNNKKLILATMSDYKNYLTKDSNSVLVLASNSKDTIDEFLSQLNITSGILIYGNKSWLKNKNYASQLLSKPGFYFADYNDFNYSNEQVKELHRKYRRKYNTDITKMAVVGYDMFNFFFNYFFTNKPYNRGVMMEFEIKPNEFGSGYINMFCFLTSNSEIEFKKQQKLKEEEDKK